MAAAIHAPPLVPALATGIGSLPFTDADEAAALVLRLHGRLPAVPQLPLRSPHEGMIAQWARALPEVLVTDDGELVIDPHVIDAPPVATFDDAAHGGLLAFVRAAAGADAQPARVKVQVTGPLTLGVALLRAGMPRERAFRRAGEAVATWITALDALVAARLPGATEVLFLDEPALVAWRDVEEPLDREAAIDLLSSTLARTEGRVTGVHVCGGGDRRLALAAGPTILGVEVGPELIADADAISRHLDADGWIAWGAVPTHRPVGDSVEPLWRALVDVWCELTRRGCDPVRMRTQSLLTPACGLAGHGATQAEHVLALTRTLADRVHDQAVAARLTLGA